MDIKGLPVPGDFHPVSGCVPTWIDFGEVCKEAKRFVGLYALANFDIVAINSGKAIYTTADVNGEFRRTLDRVAPGLDGSILTAQSKPDTIIYDCEAHQQWLAPRDSAVRFLYQQF
jgi:hypothetical protein